MTLQLTTEELREMMRGIVQEELSLRAKEATAPVDTTVATAEDSEVERITREIFDKYDDVFKALA